MASNNKGFSFELGTPAKSLSAPEPEVTGDFQPKRGLYNAMSSIEAFFGNRPEADYYSALAASIPSKFKSFDDVHGVGDFVDYWQQQSGDQVAPMGLMAASGGFAGGAARLAFGAGSKVIPWAARAGAAEASAIQNTGDMINEARQNGYEMPAAGYIIGQGMGGLDAFGLETAISNVMKTAAFNHAAADRSAKAVIGQELWNATKTFGAAIGKANLAEVPPELAQEALAIEVRDMAQRGYANTKEADDRLKETAIATGVVSSGFGLMGGGKAILQDKFGPKPQQEVPEVGTQQEVPSTNSWPQMYTPTTANNQPTEPTWPTMYTPPKPPVDANGWPQMVEPAPKQSNSGMSRDALEQSIRSIAGTEGNYKAWSNVGDGSDKQQFEDQLLFPISQLEAAKKNGVDINLDNVLELLKSSKAYHNASIRSNVASLLVNAFNSPSVDLATQTAGMDGGRALGNNLMQQLGIHQSQMSAPSPKPEAPTSLTDEERDGLLRQLGYHEDQIRAASSEDKDQVLKRLGIHESQMTKPSPKPEAPTSVSDDELDTILKQLGVRDEMYGEPPLPAPKKQKEKASLDFLKGLTPENRILVDSGYTWLKKPEAPTSVSDEELDGIMQQLELRGPQPSPVPTTPSKNQEPVDELSNAKPSGEALMDAGYYKLSDLIDRLDAKPSGVALTDSGYAGLGEPSVQAEEPRRRVLLTRPHLAGIDQATHELTQEGWQPGDAHPSWAPPVDGFPTDTPLGKAMKGESIAGMERTTEDYSGSDKVGQYKYEGDTRDDEAIDLKADYQDAGVGEVLNGHTDINDTYYKPRLATSNYTSIKYPLEHMYPLVNKRLSESGESTTVMHPFLPDGITDTLDDGSNPKTIYVDDGEGGSEFRLRDPSEPAHIHNTRAAFKSFFLALSNGKGKRFGNLRLSNENIVNHKTGQPSTYAFDVSRLVDFGRAVGNYADEHPHRALTTALTHLASHGFQPGFTNGKPNNSMNPNEWIPKMVEQHAPSPEEMDTYDPDLKALERNEVVAIKNGMHWKVRKDALVDRGRKLTGNPTLLEGDAITAAVDYFVKEGFDFGNMKKSPAEHVMSQFGRQNAKYQKDREAAGDRKIDPNAKETKVIGSRRFQDAVDGAYTPSQLRNMKNTHERNQSAFDGMEDRPEFDDKEWDATPEELERSDSRLGHVAAYIRQKVEALRDNAFQAVESAVKAKANEPTVKAVGLATGVYTFDKRTKTAIGNAYAALAELREANKDLGSLKPEGLDRTGLNLIATAVRTGKTVPIAESLGVTDQNAVNELYKRFHRLHKAKAKIRKDFDIATEGSAIHMAVEAFRNDTKAKNPANWMKVSESRSSQIQNALAAEVENIQRTTPGIKKAEAEAIAKRKLGVFSTKAEAIKAIKDGIPQHQETLVQFEPRGDLVEDFIPSKKIYTADSLEPVEYDKLYSQGVEQQLRNHDTIFGKQTAGHRPQSSTSKNPAPVNLVPVNIGPKQWILQDKNADQKPSTLREVNLVKDAFYTQATENWQRHTYGPKKDKSAPLSELSSVDPEYKQSQAFDSAIENQDTYKQQAEKEIPPRPSNEAEAAEYSKRRAKTREFLDKFFGGYDNALPVRIGKNVPPELGTYLNTMYKDIGLQIPTRVTTSDMLGEVIAKLKADPSRHTEMKMLEQAMNETGPHGFAARTIYNDHYDNVTDRTPWIIISKDALADPEIRKTLPTVLGHEVGHIIARAWYNQLDKDSRDKIEAELAKAGGNTQEVFADKFIEWYQIHGTHNEVKQTEGKEGFLAKVLRSLYDQLRGLWAWLGQHDREFRKNYPQLNTFLHSMVGIRNTDFKPLNPKINNAMVNSIVTSPYGLPLNALSEVPGGKPKTKEASAKAKTTPKAQSTKKSNRTPPDIFEPEFGRRAKVMQRKDPNHVGVLRSDGDGKFGNPFVVKGGPATPSKGDVPNAGTVEEVSRMFYEWVNKTLRPSDKVSQEQIDKLEPRRQAIEKAINAGELDGMTLVYFKNNNPTSHAEMLVKLVEESIARDAGITPIVTDPVEALIQNADATPAEMDVQKPNGALEALVAQQEGAVDRADEPSKINPQDLLSPGLRDQVEILLGQTGWAEQGGHLIRDKDDPAKISRTKWIPKYEWWLDRPANTTESDFHKTWGTIQAGRRLGKKQQAIAEFLYRQATLGENDYRESGYYELDEQLQKEVDVLLSEAMRLLDTDLIISIKYTAANATNSLNSYNKWLKHELQQALDRYHAGIGSATQQTENGRSRESTSRDRQTLGEVPSEQTKKSWGGNVDPIATSRSIEDLAREAGFTDIGQFRGKQAQKQKAPPRGKQKPKSWQQERAEKFEREKAAFLGYSRVLPNTGVGLDEEMRAIADVAITELHTRGEENSPARTAKDELANTGTLPEIVLLIRDEEFLDSPLKQETINAIEAAAADPDFKYFIVGDTPGSDSKFVEYIQEHEHPFKIYYEGARPKIAPSKDPSIIAQKILSDGSKFERDEHGAFFRITTPDGDEFWMNLTRKGELAQSYSPRRGVSVFDAGATDFVEGAARQLFNEIHLIDTSHGQLADMSGVINAPLYNDMSMAEAAKIRDQWIDKYSGEFDKAISSKLQKSVYWSRKYKAFKGTLNYMRQKKESLIWTDAAWFRAKGGFMSKLAEIIHPEPGKVMQRVALIDGVTKTVGHSFHSMIEMNMPQWLDIELNQSRVAYKGTDGERKEPLGIIQVLKMIPTKPMVKIGSWEFGTWLDSDSQKYKDAIYGINHDLPYEQLNDLGKAIKDYFHNLYGWLKAKGVDVNFKGNYSTKLFDVKRLLENQAEVLKLFERIYTDRLANGEKPIRRRDRAGNELSLMTPREMAEYEFNRITTGQIDDIFEAMTEIEEQQLLEDMGARGPAFPQQRTRPFHDSEYIKYGLNDYLTTDIPYLLHSYTRNAVRRAVWQEIAGLPPEVFKDLKLFSMMSNRFRKAGLALSVMKSPIAALELGLAEMRQYQQISPEDYKEAVLHHIPAIFGQLNVGGSPGTRKFLGYLSAYEIMRTMSTAVFSSIPDLGVIEWRGEDFDLFMKSARSIMWKEDREQQRRFANTIGLILPELIRHALTSDIATNDAMVSKASYMTDAFFRINGMHALSEFSVILASKLAEDYIESHAAKALAGGIRTASDAASSTNEEAVKSWKRLQELHPDLTPEYAQAADRFDEVRVGAIHKFVNEAHVRNQPGTVPWWMEDWRFKIFGLLKGFAFRYHDIVYTMMKNRMMDSPTLLGAAMPLLALAVPTTLLAALGYEAREWLKYEAVPWITGTQIDYERKEKSLNEKLWQYLSMTGIPGLYAGFFEQARRGMGVGQSPVVTLAGPAVVQAFDISTKTADEWVPYAIPLMAQFPSLRAPLRREMHEMGFGVRDEED